MKNKTLKIIFIILGILTFITIFTGFILYLKIEPKINLIGEKNVTINLNDNYIEKGATAFILKKDVSNEIDIKGNVNTNIIGIYNIEYKISSKYLRKSNSIIRTINVIDSIAPEIKLKGNEKINIYVGEKYNEPGYTATDNYDKDITNLVTITNSVNVNKKGTYEITYSVSDSSNNKTEVKRTIIIKEKPIVKNTSTSVKKSGNGLPVLMYHYFYDSRKGEKGKNSNWMDIVDFEKQVKYLVDNNYYFPSWDEVYDYVQGKIKLPKKSVVITVDDGHGSFFSKAIPVVKKYNAKATGFIITSEDSPKFKSYISDNISFQSHTHNMHHGGCSGGHGGIFRCIDYSKGLDDLKKSISILNSNSAIAYPYGETTDNILKITKAAGFKLAFTTNYGKVYPGMNRYKLPRVRMSRGVSLTGFKNSL